MKHHDIHQKMNPAESEKAETIKPEPRKIKKSEQMTPPHVLLRRKRIIAIVSVCIFLAFTVIIAYFIGRPLIKMAEDTGAFRAWAKSKGFLGMLMMIGIMMLQIFVAIIPGEPFELGAGYAFGVFEGTVLCLIGAVLASAIIFSLVKRFGRRVVELFVDPAKIDSFSVMKNHKKLDLLVFLLFMIPGTPKDMLIYLVGLTPMELPAFLGITTVARIPSVLSSAIVGSLVNADRTRVAIIVYAITLFISLACIIGYRIWNKQQKQAEEGQAERE